MAAIELEDGVVEKCKNLNASDLEQPDNFWMNMIIEIAPSAEEQIKYILLALQATDEFYDKVHSKIKEIEKVLSSHFNSVVIKPFGSLLTGLALKYSDGDVAIEYTGILGSHLWIVRSIIKKSGLFVEVDGRDATVPIVKCESPEVSLDISFSNEFGVQSSLFLKEVLNADQRIKSLVIILRFWLMKQGLKLKRYPKLSSYPLSLLIIFYLQQKNYLNSVHEMQKFAPSKMVRGWNFSFLPSSIRVGNLPPVLDLLKGFFEYYADFDYKNQVVCPYTGQKLSKQVIRLPQSLPNEYDLYKKYNRNNRSCLFKSSNGLNIQDVFVHDRNSTSNMSESTAEGFRKLCAFSCEIFKEEEGKSCEKKGLFCELFKPYKIGF